MLSRACVQAQKSAINVTRGQFRPPEAYCIVSYDAHQPQMNDAGRIAQRLSARAFAELLLLIRP
jgi:hypothetical protein